MLELLYQNIIIRSIVLFISKVVSFALYSVPATELITRGCGSMQNIIQSLKVPGTFISSRHASSLNSHTNLMRLVQEQDRFYGA